LLPNSLEAQHRSGGRGNGTLRLKNTETRQRAMRWWEKARVGKSVFLSGSAREL
jgi:hypothetical protein